VVHAGAGDLPGTGCGTPGDRVIPSTWPRPAIHRLCASPTPLPDREHARPKRACGPVRFLRWSQPEEDRRGPATGNVAADRRRPRPGGRAPSRARRPAGRVHVGAKVGRLPSLNTRLRLSGVLGLSLGLPVLRRAPLAVDGPLAFPGGLYVDAAVRLSPLPHEVDTSNVQSMSGRDLRARQPRSLGSGLGVRCLYLGRYNRVVLGVRVERAPFRA
jgi:hypothetical protein